MKIIISIELYGQAREKAGEVADAMEAAARDAVTDVLGQGFAELVCSDTETE